jgi:hypothetical protein
MIAPPAVRMLIVIALAFTAAASGCDPSDPCDPGYYEEHGACYPEPVVQDAGGDAQLDPGDEDAGGTPDAEAPADPYEGFGDPCEEQSDCPEALVCGAPQLALCTQVNCLDDSTVCPPGWTCFDTMGMSPDPSVTSVCLMF